MSLDREIPGSKGWWAARLLDRLADQVERYDMLDDYFRNESDIPVPATRAVRQSFQRLMAIAKTNFAELIVEAVRDRMQPIGFRTGADSDDVGDEVAWHFWQANELDADSSLVTRTALSLGDAYVIVGGVDPEIDAPLITPEDPRQVITEQDPVRRRRTIAALKVYRDDLAGADVLYLYLPGRVFRAFRPLSSALLTDFEAPMNLDASGWEWENDIGEALPANVVPVVRFANNPDLRTGRSWSEYEPHLSILDRINFSVLQRVEIATLQAFRQRAVKGVPNEDEFGEPIDYDDVFAADPGALWVLPETAEIWESGQVDLGPIRQAVRDDIQDLAAVTRTPLFYFTPDDSNSAESAALKREGLIFKTRDRLAQHGESWEQVMSLAFLFAGDPIRASRRDLEILWADPERHSLAERADAATKYVSVGVPWESVVSDVLQYTPQGLARMQTQRASEALLAAAADQAWVAQTGGSISP
jgi:Phage portal protein, SPP1 Gp6-like